MPQQTSSPASRTNPHAPETGIHAKPVHPERPDQQVAELRRLLVALTKGSERAAEALWRGQHPMVYAVALSVLTRPADAEDAAQRVFCKLLTVDRRSIRSLEDPRAWLAVMARRTAIDLLRARQRGSGTGSEFESKTGSVRSAELAPEPDEVERLRAAVAGLPEPEREAVALHHATGLSLTRLAAVLGVAKSTLADRYNAGLLTLRASLAPKETGPSDSAPKEARRAP